MQTVYALVTLIPLLLIGIVLTTFRRIRFRRRNTEVPTQMHVARFIALPFIWNAVLAYMLLVALPAAFGPTFRL